MHYGTSDGSYGSGSAKLNFHMLLLYYKNLLVFAVNAMLVLTKCRKVFFDIKSEDPKNSKKNQPRIFLDKDLNN